MSDQKKGIQEGPPIWVESLMSADEHKQCHKLYPQTVTKPNPVQFDPSYHKGGKWRARMGSSLTPEEIRITNKRLDELYKLVQT